VNKNFTEAGIMVHAYLMYGFPTQTAQETIDSLEMVRQLFAAGILQSAFWHLFTMTAHSPVGLAPQNFSVKKKSELVGRFANNDIEHEDPVGADHESFGYGLKKSLLNYMHGACFDYPLQKWFDFKVPKPSVAPDFITKAVEEQEYAPANDHQKIVWLGKTPSWEIVTKSKKGAQWEVMSINFQTKINSHSIQVDPQKGAWLLKMLPQLSIQQVKQITVQQLREDFESSGLEDFELFWDNKPVNALYKAGLLRL
jgi:hypothetical protein